MAGEGHVSRYRLVHRGRRVLLGQERAHYPDQREDIPTANSQPRPRRSVMRPTVTARTSQRMKPPSPIPTVHHHMLRLPCRVPPLTSRERDYDLGLGTVGRANYFHQGEPEWCGDTSPTPAHTRGTRTPRCLSLPHTVRLIGNVAIQPSVARNTTTPNTRRTRRMRGASSLVEIPAKKSAAANSTTPST